MKSYEGLFIYPPDAAAEVRKTQDKSLEDLVKKFEGKILQKMEWGRKPLGYPLKKFREGYFVVLEFQLPPLKMNEFRKALELQTDFLKFMLTIKQAKAPLKPAEKSPAPAVSASHAATAPRP